MIKPSEGGSTYTNSVLPFHFFFSFLSLSLCHAHTRAQTHTHTHTHKHSRHIPSFFSLGRMPIRVPVTQSSLLGQSKHNTGCYLITIDSHQPSPSSASPSSLIALFLPPLFPSYLPFSLMASCFLYIHLSFIICFHLFFPARLLNHYYLITHQ